ncbi:GrpB domain, predicted nucleotidyltransferase, UPF0157 family [Fictibacillus solisalsi]|uniref:GrpB domain, predicted nucleotidyltransferase, UPF0157 family n=1 Tax=Fictibacillus solisalsi TaxID=459525 RepID=A0A1G9ZTL0_9BACL|nr:GrpB family protein [Fictibacillus solisalsi]SDN24972.1 GrpB domain, predicted nucleotidyltransferase, UPF0157 family [Fictibacillus solisalsi]
MEHVHFSHSTVFQEKAEQTFSLHKKIIQEKLPRADVQHVGSTVIPNCITKGDLDIQVRVLPEDFPKALAALSKRYEINEGSVATESFRALKDDSTDPPLGVQLTVIDSEFDFFWKFRDVLLRKEEYRKEYDDLKMQFEGKDMEAYRDAKNEFFQKLMKEPEFQ